MERALTWGSVPRTRAGAPCSQGLPRPARDDPGEGCASLLRCKFRFTAEELPVRSAFGNVTASHRGREGWGRRGCFPRYQTRQTVSPVGCIGMVLSRTAYAGQSSGQPGLLVLPCLVAPLASWRPYPVHPLYFRGEISFFPTAFDSWSSIAESAKISIPDSFLWACLFVWLLDCLFVFFTCLAVIYLSTCPS